MRFTGLLSAPISTNAYVPNNVSIFGNIAQRTLSGKSYFGPGLTNAQDYQTDFFNLFTSTGIDHTTSNNRKFVLSSIVAGVASIALYSVNKTTFECTPLGRVLITLPNSAATTHTPRWIRVIDTGTTGWKIYIGTVGSVVQNGGTFLINKVDLTDFSFSVTPTQIFMALSTDIKGTYFYQDPTAIGAAHVQTTTMGGGYHAPSDQIITVKGTAASLSHDGFDNSVAPTIVDYPCTSPTVAASPTFTMTGHPFVAGDQLVFKASAPTGFTLSTQVAVQTVYFVRAANLTANTFELSATSGGVAINATSVVTPTLVRAFGISSNAYLASRKTGTIATGFAGTALLVGSCKIITPTDGINAGTVCFFFPTSSNFYCWPLASITTGVTSLIGNQGVNNSGAGNDYTAITTTFATYSEVLGKIIYTSAAFGFFMKGWQNSNIFASFGTQINTWLENTGRGQDYFRGMAILGIEASDGIIYVHMNTVGQRVFLMIDARSDARIGFSYLVSPVTKIGVATLKFLTTIETLFDVTDTIELEYKTAATEVDAIFTDHTTGWTSVDTNSDLSTISILGFIQIRCKWDVLSTLSGIPTQLSDILAGYTLLSDNSLKWLPWNDKTTRDGESPSFAAFLQKEIYSSVVPLRFYALDLTTGNVTVTATTDVDWASFDKTTDSGVSWSAMTGPNDIPNVALTSGIRYKYTGAVPGQVIVSLQEK